MKYFQVDRNKSKIAGEGNQYLSESRYFLIILLLPVLIYLPGIVGWVPYPSETAKYTDLLLTHYPNAVFLRNSIIQNHAIPLWSNLIYSGIPFAANPLSGVWYLPGWLALLFPLPAGISLVLAGHSVFGTIGFYKFLRGEDIGIFGALCGGLVFGLMPKIAAHYGAGHVTLLYALAWTPWLFFVSKRDKKGWKTGLILACLFLADPRWSVFAGILWLTFDIAHRHKDIKNAVLFYAKTGLLSFLLASPLILSLLEYTSLSTRSLMTAEDILISSLPPENLIGLIIPGSGSNPEWYMYPGGLMLVLFVTQFFFTKLRKKNYYWLTWIILSLIISLGSLIPGAQVIAEIPLISLLRVPSRALFITGLAFAVITGITIDWLQTHNPEKKIFRRISFGILVFSTLLGAAIVLNANAELFKLLWGFGFLVISGILLLFLSNKLTSNFSKWLIIMLISLDLLGAGYLSFSYKMDNISTIAETEIAEYLEKDQEYYRIYSPSYSISQNLAAEQSLELADGVDPLQIKSYSEFMVSATGIPESGYSVTIPPFVSGNPSVDNQGNKPDAKLLGLLNVKYVVSEFKIITEGLVLHETESELEIYLNELYLPRAWIEELEIADSKSGNNKRENNIRWIEKEPNLIHLEVDGPGRLVLSEIYYPGWVAYVDGIRQDIEPAYDVLRSISLVDGTHDIYFKFRPISIYVGLILAAFGWIYTLWNFSNETN